MHIAHTVLVSSRLNSEAKCAQMQETSRRTDCELDSIGKQLAETRTKLDTTESALQQRTAELEQRLHNEQVTAGDRETWLQELRQRLEQSESERERLQNQL